MKKKINKVLNIIIFILLIVMTVSYALWLSKSDAVVELYSFGYVLYLAIVYGLVIICFWYNFIKEMIESWKKPDIPAPTPTPPADRETPPYTRREWYQIGYKDGYDKALKDVGYKK